MEKLNKASGVDDLECISETLDLFSKPYLDTSLDYYYYQEINPTSALSETSNTIQFLVPISDDYTDLKDSYIKLKLKLKTHDNKKLGAQTAASSYSIVNQPISSVFSSVNIKLNGHLISDSYACYNYLAFIQSLFSYNGDSRGTITRLLGFDEDDDPTQVQAHDDAVHSSFKTRAEWVTGSNSATFIGPVFHEFMHQGRALIPHVEMSFEFVKAPASFVVISNLATCNYQYEIEELKMFVKRMKILPSVKLDLEAKLEKEPARYPLTQSSVKPYFIDENQVSASFENVFGGRNIPSFCAVMFLPQDAFRGHYNKAPYLFENHSLSQLKISFNGMTFPSAGGFQPKYTSTTAPDWTREYLSLFENTFKKNSGIGISYDEFKSAYAIYCFDFGRNPGHSTDHVNAKKSASARLDISFETGTKNPALVCLIYSECDQEIQITG